MISPYIMAWLIIGLILAEFSLCHSGPLKLQPLAYIFVVTLWPVMLPIALLVAIYSTIKKGTRK